MIELDVIEITLIPQESNPIPLSEAERNLQVVEMMLEENIVNSNDKSMYASDVPTPFGKCQSLYEVAVYLNKVCHPFSIRISFSPYF